MKEQWLHLESNLKRSNPSLFEDLAPPATSSEINDLEKKLGVTLPKDFVECLKIHNGQYGHAEGLFSGLEFLSTKRILEEWTIWKGLFDYGDFNDLKSDSDKGINSKWWDMKWIPFTYNGSGDHLCLDLNPTEEGEIGQIITLWHDNGERKKKASSFSEWFICFTNKSDF